MRCTSGFLLFLLAFGISKTLPAQTSSVSGPPMQITPEIAASLLASMASDLRSLVTAQEEYYSNNARYGRVLSSADRSKVYIIPSPGVTLTLTYVTINTWAARANHEWMRWSCVITVGQVAQSRIPSTAVQGLLPKQEGSPVCDQP